MSEPAEALRQIAFQLERGGAPTYRVRAFRNAAEVLDGLAPGELDRRIAAGTLEALKGIGATTAEVITQAAAGQQPDYLARLLAEQPPAAERTGLRAALPGAVHGSSWTTDAPYRETAEEVAKYRADGIVTVEMEASCLFTVASSVGAVPVTTRDACAVAAPKRRLAVNDAVGEPPQRAGQLRGICVRETALLERTQALRQIERIAGEDDLKLDLVVQLRPRQERIDVVIDEAPGKICRQIARHERVEADAHVDVRQPVEADQQGKAAQVLVTVVVALIRPDGIGHELAVQR